ncbi:HI1506-related protein [Oceanospirillum sp.]|uniref:HI1506-related protein n=1 Tax=Oceanospirillum sp. TaxID=2021254 RepID=UPI003A8FD80E
MPITIVSTLEGYRRAGMAHSKTPVSHPDGTFSKQQLAQLQADPRITITLDTPAGALSAPEDIADPAGAEPETEGVLDDEALAGDLMSGDELADLVAHISELDSKDAELWMTNGAPKTSAMPSGTSADERDAAWAAYQSLVAESAESQEAEE